MNAVAFWRFGFGRPWNAQVWLWKELAWFWNALGLAWLLEILPDILFRLYFIGQLEIPPDILRTLVEAV